MHFLLPIVVDFAQMRPNRKRMPRSAPTLPAGQFDLFPQSFSARPGSSDSSPTRETTEKRIGSRGSSVVLCGTYRKDPEGLRQTFEQLRDSGFTVLSPTNA